MTTQAESEGWEEREAESAGNDVEEESYRRTIKIIPASIKAQMH